MSDAVAISTLKERLSYDPESGVLTWRPRPPADFKSKRMWRRWNTRHAGKPAGHVPHHGYRQIVMQPRTLRAHRVAWAIFYGAWPAGHIDHVNGDRDDNSIRNLRVVTQKENSRNQGIRRNNKSGVVGVCRYKSGWRATIRRQGKQVHLGVFETLESAARARRLAEQSAGYHERHGTRAAYAAREGIELSEPQQDMKG